jgi:cholesterol transport system auxiliary component
MRNVTLKSLPRVLVAALSLAVAGGCSGIFPVAAPQVAVYSLDVGPSEKSRVVPRAIETLPTLIVSPVQAAAGYDSPRMLYMRDANQLEYFAHSEWVDTPARMITASVVTALEMNGAFRAVVLTPTPAVGDLRLTLEVVRLHQQFGGGPSRVRFTMRAYLVDYATRKVLASNEFDETVAAARESPEGGVVAANRAVQAAMSRLAIFCAEAALQWQVANAPQNRLRK